MAGLNLPTYLTLSMPSPPCHFLLNRKISGTNNCHFSNISKIFPPIKLPAGTESKNPIFLGALGRHSHWFRSRCCFELQFLDCRLEGKKVAWLACPSSFHFESDQSRWFYFFFFCWLPLPPVFFRALRALRSLPHYSVRWKFPRIFWGWQRLPDGRPPNHIFLLINTGRAVIGLFHPLNKTGLIFLFSPVDLLLLAATGGRLSSSRRAPRKLYNVVMMTVPILIALNAAPLIWQRPPPNICLPLHADIQEAKMGSLETLTRTERHIYSPK